MWSIKINKKIIKHYEIKVFKNLYKIIGVHIYPNAQLWINCIFMVTHPQIPWKIQIQVSKWKHRKELKYVPSLTTLQG
jgi:hypothetical protein